VMLRGGDPRDGRQRGSARGQMQKISAGKFHFEPPFTSFDHLVGAGEQRRGDFEPKRVRGAEVDHQIELGRQLDRQVTGLFPLEYAGGVHAKKAITFVLIGAIAHEPASGGKLTSRIQRRNRMAGGQHHKLRGAREEEWIGRD